MTAVRPTAGAVAAALVGAVVLAACGGGGPTRRADGRLSVEASFYPLQWVAKQVGGDRVVVDGLTKPGAEPHDLELSPREVAKVQDANVVLYLSGFQPSVDDAVDGASGVTVFDARSAAELDLRYSPIEGGRQQPGDGGTDPHFWLDPVRLARVARAFGATLAEADPDHAGRYRGNVSRVVGELEALDHEFRSGLERCRDRDLVTSHNAFGYLARRYGFKQVGITGITPEQEPSPSDLAAVSDFVQAHDVRTIYSETLVSARIAKVVAQETGARTAVLDPVEGLNDRSTGADYLSVMRDNLATIEAGQRCR